MLIEKQLVRVIDWSSVQGGAPEEYARGTMVKGTKLLSCGFSWPIRGELTADNERQMDERQ